MKNSYKSLWLLVVSILFGSFLLAGCDSQPEYEKKIISYTQGRLKDPDSVQFTFQGHMKGKIDGYEADVYLIYINAKNSYGAYTGPKEYYFAIYKNPAEKSAMLAAEGGVEDVSKVVPTNRFEVTQKMKIIGK